MKVLGYSRKHLSFDDGRTCDGCFLYLSEERRDTVGVATERIFLSDAKGDGYNPSVGDEIKVYYNRYGKVDSVELL